MNKNQNLIPLICQIHYQQSRNVDSITKNEDRFKRSITLVAGSEWEEIYFSPGTAKFEEKTKRNKAGILYNQKLSFKFPGEDDDNIEAISNLVIIPVILKVTYNNGKSKIIGDLNNPVKVDQDYSSDNKAIQFDFVIEHESSHPAYWFETISGGEPPPDE